MHKECTQRGYKGITVLSNKAKETTNSPTEAMEVRPEARDQSNKAP